jgi:hypothetical protein
VRERSEGDHDHTGDERGRELEREREPNEPVEPAPFLPRGVAEAVLDQRLVARQLEQELDERVDAHHDRVATGPSRAEDAEDDERTRDPEHGRPVDPDRGDDSPTRVTG